MEVTFLGTGTSQGVPLIGCECDVCKSADFRDNRLRTSVHLKIGDKSIVIDTGPDFRQQMLRERVKNLDAILFTHEHKDHTAGLDDVRAYNYKQGNYMKVYGRKRVLEHLKIEFSYAFTETVYPGAPQIELNEIGNKPFQVEGINIIPIDCMHYKIPVFGFRIGDFTYLTDTNFISEEEQKKIIGSKVIVINGLQKEYHISHFTLDQSVALLQKWQPEKAFLTHISHRLGKHAVVENELPAFIKPAFDGLKIKV